MSLLNTIKKGSNYSKAIALSEICVVGWTVRLRDNNFRVEGIGKIR